MTTAITTLSALDKFKTHMDEGLSLKYFQSKFKTFTNSLGESFKFLSEDELNEKKKLLAAVLDIKNPVKFSFSNDGEMPSVESFATDVKKELKTHWLFLEDNPYVKFDAEFLEQVAQELYIDVDALSAVQMKPILCLRGYFDETEGNVEKTYIEHEKECFSYRDIAVILLFPGFFVFFGMNDDLAIDSLSFEFARPYNSDGYSALVDVWEEDDFLL